MAAACVAWHSVEAVPRSDRQCETSRAQSTGIEILYPVHYGQMGVVFALGV